jgi:hypothetical protein
MSMNHRLPVDYPIMTWGIILLEVFEVLAIFVIFFCIVEVVEICLSSQTVNRTFKRMGYTSYEA